jgi:hypothetical protein
MKQENDDLLNKVALEEIDLLDNRETFQSEPIVTKKIETKNNEKPKKSHRKLIIILVSIAVTAAVVAFVVWLFMFKGIY